jgi:hypothetical protein
MADLSAATRNLIRLGKALHGERWQRPIARDLGVDNKTVWRWIRGEGRPTSDDLRRLEAVVRQRRDNITEALEAKGAYLTYRQWAALAAEKQTPKNTPAQNAPAPYTRPPMPLWRG